MCANDDALRSHAQVASAHDGAELGIGDAILVKALAEATGRSREKVRPHALWVT